MSWGRAPPCHPELVEGRFAARAGRGLLLLSVAGKREGRRRSFVTPLGSRPVTESLLRDRAAENDEHQARQDQRHKKCRRLYCIRMNVVTAHNPRIIPRRSSLQRGLHTYFARAIPGRNRRSFVGEEHAPAHVFPFGDPPQCGRTIQASVYLRAPVPAERALYGRGIRPSVGPHECKAFHWVAYV